MGQGGGGKKEEQRTGSRIVNLPVNTIYRNERTNDIAVNTVGAAERRGKRERRRGEERGGKRGEERTGDERRGEGGEGRGGRGRRKTRRF